MDKPSAPHRASAWSPARAGRLAVGHWWARAPASTGGQCGRFAGSGVRDGREVLAQRPEMEPRVLGLLTPLPCPHSFVI